MIFSSRAILARSPPAETMFPLSELDRMLPLSDTAGGRSSRPSVSSRGTRTILKEPESRRLKNRGHLARNRKFESISLQRRVKCEPDFLTIVGALAPTFARLQHHLVRSSTGIYRDL